MFNNNMFYYTKWLINSQIIQICIYTKYDINFTSHHIILFSSKRTAKDHGLEVKQYNPDCLD